MIDVLVPENWHDFELIDSGEGAKLERWGGFILARPEPRAIWNKADLAMWKKAEAVYERETWNYTGQPPKEWTIGYKNIRFKLKPTDFKHTGVFPEQASNWDWLLNMKDIKGSRVLNLFAYTGGATMAAAKAGAHVTHVDASRPAMMWASENAALSGVSKESVRWIQDDALKFVKREQRRGVFYDGIIMDPPRFGRGANGEVWKLEESLPELVWECNKILSPTPKFYLINAYTADLSSVALGNLLRDALKKEVQFGELGLKETAGGRILPAGIFARVSW